MVNIYLEVLVPDGLYFSKYILLVSNIKILVISVPNYKHWGLYLKLAESANVVQMRGLENDPNWKQLI